MDPQVLAFAGAIASGKTTLSREVASTLGWSRVSFGDAVRQEAMRRGLDTLGREVLQSLGDELIAQGWEPFCRRVLTQAMWEAGQPLVVDGIRHVEALDMLRRLVSPLRVRLVFVGVAPTERQERLRSRGVNVEAQVRLDNHATEADVASRLPLLADYYVQPESSLVDAHSSLLQWLSGADSHTG